MAGSWLGKACGSVPRGFSRYFVLELLREGPRTGKEVIDCAGEQSGGIWRPSPGLIYPLLGRMLDEGLIEEAGDGRYSLTEAGRGTAADIDRVGEAVRRQLDVLFRLGNVGRFVAADLIERISAMGSVLGANAGRMTEEETGRYRRFLESELERIGGAAPGGARAQID